jgi:hypothetical protein
MDGFLPFSEEERGPTPTELPGPSSHDAAFTSGGMNNRHITVGGKSGVEALRININKLGGAGAGLSSNGHAASATPNASLVGNRAKMRWGNIHLVS